MANPSTHHCDLIAQTELTCLHDQIPHGTLRASPQNPWVILQPLLLPHRLGSLHPPFSTTQTEQSRGSTPTGGIQRRLAFPLPQYRLSPHQIACLYHHSLPPRHVR